MGQVFSFPTNFSLSGPKLSVCRGTVFLDMVSTFDLHTIRMDLSRIEKLDDGF